MARATDERLGPLSLGLRCWPQWRGWRFCPVTGDLLDPSGQPYTPALIQAGAWLLCLHELRDRVIFADTPQLVPVLRNSDLASQDDSLRGLRARQRAYWRNRRRARRMRQPA